VRSIGQNFVPRIAVLRRLLRCGGFQVVDPVCRAVLGGDLEHGGLHATVARDLDRTQAVFLPEEVVTAATNGRGHF
jgi:hypothetical protein